MTESNVVAGLTDEEAEIACMAGTLVYLGLMEARRDPTVTGDEMEEVVLHARDLIAAYLEVNLNRSQDKAKAIATSFLILMLTGGLTN